MWRSIRVKSSNDSDSEVKKLSKKMRAPESDVDLPKKKPFRRRSSLLRGDFLSQSRFLRSLRDIDPKDIEAREALFKQKLSLCETCFYFDTISEPPKDYQKAMEVKRETLLELVEYVAQSKNKPALSKRVLSNVFSMVSKNLFRSLPPMPGDYDPDEDEPIMESSWPHLQVVYEFLLRVIVSSEIKSKTAKAYVNNEFVGQLVSLFNSDDPRERDYLKTIVHRIYAKFMQCRSYIRRIMGEEFRNFVHNTNRHNGIGEMLMILGSIITGFSKPIKKEHLDFLERAILPLHRPEWVTHYHPQLAYCMIQYVVKDPSTASIIVNYLRRFWPWQSSPKQLLFVNELEEILEHLQKVHIVGIESPLFALLAQCVSSAHFQVAQRTMYMWNNDQLKKNGCFGTEKDTAQFALKYVVAPLEQNMKDGHWNETVVEIATGIVDSYEVCATKYFQEAKNDNTRKRKEEKVEAAARDSTYAKLDKLCASKDSWQKRG